MLFFFLLIFFIPKRSDWSLIWMFVSFSSHSWQWHSKVSFNCDSLRTEKRAHKTETLAVSAFNFMTNRLSCWHNFQRVINRFFAVFLASNQAILNELTIRNFCGRWQNAIQIKCIRFLKLCKFEMRVCVCERPRAHDVVLCRLHYWCTVKSCRQTTEPWIHIIFAGITLVVLLH